MGNRLPSALREDDLKRRMPGGAELERWKRAYPEAWKEFEASEPQRAKGRAAGSDDAGDSNDVYRRSVSLPAVDVSISETGAVHSSCTLRCAASKETNLNTIEQALRSEIDRREREINALRSALAALTVGDAPARGRKPGRLAKASKAAAGKGTGKRRPKTAAEKKVLSEKLKAAWKRRQAAGKKAVKAPE
jgi:hypothetical protein